MSEKSWIEQLNQVVLPIAVVLVGGYGAWDLVIKPWTKETPISEACTPTVTGTYIDIPGKAGRPAKQIKMASNLPAVVPAGEKRSISVQLNNPDDKPVVYTWKATYGRFESGVTSDGRSTYIAPPNLVDDSILVEVRMQGCTVVTQTAKIAVTLSASTPTQPLGTPIPLNPNLPPESALPSPAPAPTTTP
jgi:hypothetical protein